MQTLIKKNRMGDRIGYVLLALLLVTIFALGLTEEAWNNTNTDEQATPLEQTTTFTPNAPAITITTEDLSNIARETLFPNLCGAITAEDFRMIERTEGAFRNILMEYVLSDSSPKRNLFEQGINAQEYRTLRTILNLACLQGDIKYAEFLVRNGADITIENMHGMTPLEETQVQILPTKDPEMEAKFQAIIDWLETEEEKADAEE